MNPAAAASNTFEAQRQQFQQQQCQEQQPSSSANGTTPPLQTPAERAALVPGGSSPRGIPPSSPNFRQNRHPFLIGVAGGTASGKTTVGTLQPMPA